MNPLSFNKKHMFGFGKKKKLQDFLSRGAIIIDVRSEGEFDSGHADGSLNIPLNEISETANDIKSKNVPVITCCASGMRSASAAVTLRKNRIDAMNGGAWQTVQKNLNL